MSQVEARHHVRLVAGGTRRRAGQCRRKDRAVVGVSPVEAGLTVAMVAGSDTTAAGQPTQETYRAASSSTASISAMRATARAARAPLGSRAGRALLHTVEAGLSGAE